MNKEQEENITSKTYLCLHCGNETLMKKAGELKWGSNNEGSNSVFGFSSHYQMLFLTNVQ